MTEKPDLSRITLNESYSPVGRSDYLSIQHIERYRFAASVLPPGSRVLDIASGSGYGTAMLVRHGCWVVGADYDEVPLTFANKLWKHARFIRANALRLPFSDNSFDAVVTFETIEHVVEGHEFLQEMRRVLRPGGVLICSTPNIRYTFHPAFHVKEYGAGEFFDLVEQVFPTAERYAQYFRPIDRFRDLYARNLLPTPVMFLRRAAGKLLGAAGLKAMFSRKVLGSHMTYFETEVDVDLESWLDNTLHGRGNGIYEVKSFSGEKWQRIILVVARKNE